MSGFFNETNYGRIIKMCELIEGPMDKSAASNKATPEQWRTMLEPLVNLITERVGDAAPQDAPPPAPQEPAQRTSKHPARSPQAILEGLTPEEQLSVAYVALMNIDQDIYEGKLNA